MDDEVAFIRKTNTKVDPGPLFPWGTVVPLQPKPVDVQDPTLCTHEEMQEAKALLRRLGYGGPDGVYDPESQTMKEDFLQHQLDQAVQSFKGRYVYSGKPEHYNSSLDKATLENLRFFASQVKEKF